MKQLAAFAKLCAEEAGRQAKTAVEAEKQEAGGKEDNEDDEEGGPNSTIKAM